MPPVPINYAAVVAAAVSNIVLGSLWYGPFFGKPWMQLMGYTPEKMEAMKKDPKGKAKMQKSYALAFVGALLMAYVMAHSMVFAEAYLNTSGVASGLTGGFWNWLGFVVPVTLGTVLWEMKPWKLWWINASYYLLSLCVMGVIFSLWK